MLLLRVSSIASRPQRKCELEVKFHWGKSSFPQMHINPAMNGEKQLAAVCATHSADPRETTGVAAVCATQS